MLSTQTLDTQSTGRVAVFVDLIGDLDATLGDIFAETLVRLTASGATDVFLTTRHVNGSSQSGLAAIDAALATARAGGCSVSIDPGNRRMRSAFASAHIPFASEHVAARPPHARHLMIARHAPAPTLRKSA
jgi:anti-anti-sigma regulatory factor